MTATSQFEGDEFQQAMTKPSNDEDTTQVTAPFVESPDVVTSVAVKDWSGPDRNGPFNYARTPDAPAPSTGGGTGTKDDPYIIIYGNAEVTINAWGANDNFTGWFWNGEPGDQTDNGTGWAGVVGDAALAALLAHATTDGGVASASLTGDNKYFWTQFYQLEDGLDPFTNGLDGIPAADFRVWPTTADPPEVFFDITNEGSRLLSTVQSPLTMGAWAFAPDGTDEHTSLEHFASGSFGYPDLWATASGERMIFTQNQDLWIANEFGSTAKIVTQADAIYSPKWKLDGTKIAYVDGDNLVLIDINGADVVSNTTTLVNAPVAFGAGGYFDLITWGIEDTIYFTYGADGISAEHVGSVKMDGTELTLDLANGDDGMILSGGIAYDLTNDQLFLEGTGPIIFVVDAQTGADVETITLAHNATYPGAFPSPEGDRIAYQAGADIYVCDRDGSSNEVHIVPTDMPVADSAGAVTNLSLNGWALSPVRSSRAWPSRVIAGAVAPSDANSVPLGSPVAAGQLVQVKAYGPDGYATSTRVSLYKTDNGGSLFFQKDTARDYEPYEEFPLDPFNSTVPAATQFAITSATVPGEVGVQTILVITMRDSA